LRWLLDRGFKSLLLETLDRGGWVLGVCGGYQMLGRTVSDPHGAEEGGTQDGLDLLPVQTELDVNKITVQSQGRSFLGWPVKGYEIHMGRTMGARPVAPFITKEDGAADGAVVGRIAGTYFHGLFDNADFTTRFLTVVAEGTGLDWRPGVPSYSKEAEYDRLAATVRENLTLENGIVALFTHFL
jgi:adenosylcobyric acid synthase